MMTSLGSLKSSIILLICILLFVSCRVREIYYYAIYTEPNSQLPDSYVVKEVTNKTSRKEIDSRFSMDGELKSKSVSIYKVTNSGLKKKLSYEDIKSYKPYLSIKEEGYVSFEYPNASLNDFAASYLKFTGKKDVSVGGVNYTGTYSFIKQQGSATDAVVSTVYYDKEFILIKEEFVEGGRPYYRIERTTR